MKIQSIQIKNFKNIDRASADLHGKNVYLVASNGKGKTSFIDAAFGVMPELPLKEGANKGEVIVEIDDYTLEFRFSATNQTPKLNIFDKSGEVQKAPATLFKKLFGVKYFNIEEFLSLSDEKQVDVIKNIIGVDFSDVDKRYKELFDDRTHLNRTVKDLESKLQGTPLILSTAKIDISELQKTIAEAIQKNEAIQKVEAGINQRVLTCQQYEQEIRDLENRIITLKASRDASEKEIEKGNAWLLENKKQDISEIQEQLTKAVEVNSEVDRNILIAQKREERKEAWNRIEEIEQEMQSIKDLKKRQIEEAKMPVKGLTFDDEKLLLDGFPLRSSQINTARRITVGLEIQQALMSDVRIARFDGSLLDKNSFEEVLHWAKEKDVQLFVEFVDRDGSDLQIKIEEEL